MHRLFALTVLGLVTALSACNTVAGAGQDISQGGQAVSETANEVEQSL